MPNDSRLTQVLSHKALSHLHTYNGREHTQQFKDYQNQYQMSLAQYRWKITVLYSVPSCGGLHGYPGEWKAEWRKASPMFSPPLWSPDLSLHWASQLRIWQTDILKCCTTRTSATILRRHTLIPVWARKHLSGNHPILIWISKHESSNDRTRCKMFWFHQNVYNLLYYRSTKIDHFKFLELTKSTFSWLKNTPFKFLNTVVLHTVLVHTEKNTYVHERLY